ncbi:MAG: hypothetical protein IPJ77_14445 [Planctomycetes bacterium]|nr:hypothetical protein [Planctomycetota bacterium]
MNLLTASLLVLALGASALSLQTTDTIALAAPAMTADSLDYAASPLVPAVSPLTNVPCGGSVGKIGCFNGLGGEIGDYPNTPQGRRDAYQAARNCLTDGWQQRKALENEASLGTRCEECEVEGGCEPYIELWNVLVDVGVKQNPSGTYFVKFSVSGCYAFYCSPCE